MADQRSHCANVTAWSQGYGQELSEQSLLWVLICKSLGCCPQSWWHRHLCNKNPAITHSNIISWQTAKTDVAFTCAIGLIATSSWVHSYPNPTQYLFIVISNIILVWVESMSLQLSTVFLEMWQISRVKMHVWDIDCLWGKIGNAQGIQYQILLAIRHIGTPHLLLFGSHSWSFVIDFYIKAEV